MKKLMLSVFAFAAVVLSANAADNVNGTASADLKNAISIVNTGFTPTGTNVAAGALNFGTIAIGTSATDFIITPAGLFSRTQTALGSAQSIGAGQTAAAFQVNGALAGNFTVTIGAPSGTLGGAVLSALTPSLTTGSIAAGGTQFTVGGSLNVPDNAIAGTYTATFNVSVDYN